MLNSLLILIIHAVALNCKETLQLSNYILTQYFDCIKTSLK